MSWIIRPARLADASGLPAVENSAGQRFLTIPHLAWLANGHDMPVETHRRYIALGTEWVAVRKGELVAFLAAEIIEHDLHIWEIAVRADAQNMGIGRRLIEVAIGFARDRRLRSLTLTTFADVPWNAPWYTRLGFEVCQGDERLAAVIHEEGQRGLNDRCAMSCQLHDARAESGH